MTTFQLYRADEYIDCDTTVRKMIFTDDFTFDTE